MLFNSIPFLFYFAIVYLVYWSIPYRFRQFFLILAGTVFYAYFSVAYLFHFILVILINYYLYVKIVKKEGKHYITISVVLNLLNLGFFKYYYFFTNFFGDVTGLNFFKEAHDIIQIALPLAISFYTFQMIAASIDAHRNPPKEIIPFKNYLLFTMFFPVLIAGPIMRTTDFFPNLETKEPSKEGIYRACYLMMSGLIKKILIADPIAGFILPIYGNPDEYNSITLFMAGIFYVIQVYSDFSGLTDMARSIALFLGFEIPENFYAPFFSLSGRELWKRWHFTLSFWLRDYIYFSLGGSRHSEFRTYINLTITMTLGGFWHGADYTFIAWGAYWGVLLSLERYFEDTLKFKITPEKSVILKIIKAFLVFILFSISALMFRSNSGKLMVDLFKGLFTNHSNYLRDSISVSGGDWLLQGMDMVSGQPSFLMNNFTNFESILYMYLMFLFFHYLQYKPEHFQKLRKYDFWIVTILGVITIFLLATLSRDGDAFIYYKF